MGFIDIRIINKSMFHAKKKKNGNIYIIHIIADSIVLQKYRTKTMTVVQFNIGG